MLQIYKGGIIVFVKSGSRFGFCHVLFLGEYPKGLWSPKFFAPQTDLMSDNIFSDQSPHIMQSRLGAFEQTAAINAFFKSDILFLEDILFSHWIFYSTQKQTLLFIWIAQVSI